MPEHMNVYWQKQMFHMTEVFELEEINNDFPNADVAFVIGANDVTNPVAGRYKSIYGILIWMLKNVNLYCLLKEFTPGYTGIDNDFVLLKKILTILLLMQKNG